MVSRSVTATVCALAIATIGGAAIGGQPPGQGGAQPPTYTVLGPGPSAARTPKNADEFDVMFKQISNWGRWGKDDELGSVNLITPAKRKQALDLPKVGETVSLAHNPMTDKSDDNPQPFEHTMNRGFTTDTYRVSYHGYAHSHLDALCHILYKGQTYNGYATADINTDKGCVKMGIDKLKNGIVTRAILMDIPRLKGLPYLEPGTPIFVEDLEAWEKKAGVKVSSGDAIFIRTGRWARREKLGVWPVARNAAGLHASTAPWIKARGVALVGSDVALDVVPSLVEGQGLPMHTFMITALGINLFDNQDLEALSAAAAKHNRWEFLLTVAPIPVTGGTGFPVNAIATF
jgi:kynurenine formamidase